MSAMKPSILSGGKLLDKIVGAIEQLRRIVRRICRSVSGSVLFNCVVCCLSMLIVICAAAISPAAR